MPDYGQPLDRLGEFYAAKIAEDDALPMPEARFRVDMAPETFYAFLGRMTAQDEASGYSPRYVELRALNLADIATDDERVEWAKLRAEVVVREHAAREARGLGNPEQAAEYDPDMPPAILDVSDEDQYELQRLLYQLRRIAHAQANLEEQREEVLEAAVPLQMKLGRPVTLVDPMTGVPLIAGYRQSETLKVPAGELLKELIEYHGDEDKATAIWEDVLKPREVDTKQDGLFHRMVERHTEDDPTIPPSVVAKVARFKTAKAYIGFNKPVKPRRA